MEVVRNADWVIDLGPEGGSRGGQVILEGTPLELKKAKQSITSKKYIKFYRCYRA